MVITHLNFLFELLPVWKEKLDKSEYNFESSTALELRSLLLIFYI